uniref:Uncharacterized protein n=1 Tax=Arundo donax TaxID=35708 RepID=A0A0A9SPD9_ARUDO
MLSNIKNSSIEYQEGFPILISYQQNSFCTNAIPRTSQFLPSQNHQTITNE